MAREGEQADAGQVPPEATTPTTTKKKKGVVRRIVKVLLWTLVTVIVLVLLTFVFLQTPWGKGLVKDVVLGILNDTFRGRLEVDTVDGFLPFDAELEGVRVFDPEGRLVMKVDRVTADFHPLELFDSTIHLSDARIERPLVEVFDPLGRVALARAFEPRVPPTDDTPSPWTVRFDGVALSDGRVERLAPGEDLALADVAVGVTLVITPEGLSWPDVKVQARPVGTSEIVTMLGGAGGRVDVATRGGLAAGELRIEALDVTAGSHALAANGRAMLEGALSGAFDVTHLEVALDRLPAAVRDVLAGDEREAASSGGVVQGRGHVELAPSGEALADFTLGTPYGLAVVQAGATLRAPGSTELALHDWSAELDMADVVAPPGVRQRMPPAAREARADVHVSAIGRGMPLDPGAQARVELRVDERAPHEGRLGVVLTRVEDDPRDDAASFEVAIDAEALDLQPWLGIAGEPELAGEIGVFYASGTVALPQVGLPRVALAASFDAHANGRLVAADRIVMAPQLTGSASMQWAGEGTPSGRVDLSGLDLGFDLGKVRALDVGFDVRARADGSAEVEGTVRAVDARWDTISVATLEVPIDLALEGLGQGKPVPRGTVRWRATGVDTGEQRLASTSGVLNIAPERGGYRVRGDVAAGALDLGRAIGAGAQRTTLDIDAFVAPGADGAPIGGPITARVSGEIEGARQGARRVDKLVLEDVRVALPQGPSGPIDIAGVTKVAGVSAPEVRVGGASAIVDVRLDLARGTQTGTAKVEAFDIVVPKTSPDAQAQRIDHATVDARALGDGRIAFTGMATRRARDGRDEIVELTKVDGGEDPGDVKLVGEKPGSGDGGGDTSPDEAEAPAEDGDGADGDDDGGAEGEPTRRARAVTAKFEGVLTLPGKQRALALELDELRLHRAGDIGDVLVVKDARYGADGWVTLTDLTIRPSRLSGAMTVKGRFRPSDGALDVTLTSHEVKIPSWVRLVREAAGWGGVALTGLPEAVGGTFELLTVRVGGTLAAPELSADIKLGALAWGKRGGASLQAKLRAGGSHDIEALLALVWHDGGNLSLEAKVPARASLTPLALTWRDDDPIRLALAFDESDLSEMFAWMDALSSAGAMTSAELKAQAGTDHLDGALRFDLLVEGTPRDPRLRTTLVGHPIDIGRWKDGSLVMEGSARGDASSFRMELADAKDRIQSLVDVQLPFGIARALRKDDPIGWMRGELEKKEFAVEIDVPRFVIAETPLYAFVPDNISDLAAELDLTLNGTLLDPIVSGLAELESPEASPVDVGFRMDIGTSDGVVEAYFAAARPTGEPLVDGTLAMPRLGEILRHPSLAAGLMNDPAFAVDIQSADIPSFDFWELNQGLGDLATQLFPDGRVLLDVSARGSPQGPVASVMTRIRTVTPDGVTPAARSDSTSVRRNAADDVRLAVLVAPEAMTLNVVMVQDTSSVSPFLAIQAGVAVGPQTLLSGKKVAIMDVPVQASVRAGEFRLEGFASAFRELLGTSGGTLGGELLVSGTVGAPRFAKGLRAYFEPLAVAPIGLSTPAEISVDFAPNGTDWSIIVNEIYDERRKTTLMPMSRCGVEPLKFGEQDFTERPYLTIQLNGSIPTLDPKRMTLGGCIGVRDYEAMRKKDMNGRIDGELLLGGTLAKPEVRGHLNVIEAVIAPKLASKTVRPLGSPLDVTIVRGPPQPPPVKPEKNPYKLPLSLDVVVAIPEGATRLEPSLTQLYGEMRAILYPQGTLTIRTTEGELGITGTVEVPKDRVFLYGRTFTVDPDSRVTFTGDMTRDPQLYFTARYNISHIDLSSIGLVTSAESEIVVRVTGTPTEPRLKFTSTPAMDETNILSVIALGVPAGGGGAVGEQVSAQLVTAIMGMATLQFARDFQQRLRLDVLRIEARSADPADSRLTVGKRLTENLILNYYLDLSADDEDEPRNSGSLEYRFTRYLSLLGRGGDDGDVGLELHLRFQD